MKRVMMVLAAVILSAPAGRAPAAEAALVERLGFPAGTCVLIVNGDDAGMCHAANQATIQCLEKGAMRTSTVMVPCPWFLEIADYAREHPDKDFGIHLCHTSEWKQYRWGPVAGREKVPGLVDPQGYLWHEIEQVYEHATAEEALVEGRAQIKKALAAGVDVTHLDSHMGTLQLDPRFMEVYLRLAVEFDLPLRMASQDTLAAKGVPELRAQFAAKGIVFPDYFVYEELANEKSGVTNFWLDVVKNLKPGVTELYIHAALPTEELRAITGSWSIRAQEFEVFTHHEAMRRLLEEKRVQLIGYRPLRELQRKTRAAGAAPK
jgi:chitin disaccharide deacetylase